MKRRAAKTKKRRPLQTSPGRVEARGVAQFGEELTGAAAADHVVADGDTHHRCGRDVAVVAGDDASDALVHDRQDALHLVQHVLWLDVGQRAQRISALEVDDESQRGVQPIGSTQSRHRRGDSRVEVVLLVEAERLEQSVLGTEVPVQRRARHLGRGCHVGQLQLAASVAGQYDECGRENPAARRLFGVGRRARSHCRVLYIYRSKCHTSAIGGAGVQS